MSLLIILFSAIIGWLISAQDLKNVMPGDMASHHLPIEAQHSMHHPMDTSSQYWSYGGATVAAKNFIRLTHSTQSRIGWLFNEYTLKSGEWEVEVQFEVFSDFHLGGDAFGIWFLNTTYTRWAINSGGHDWLSGQIAGMRDDFNGFGVIFDTYDNDGDRRNPTLIPVKNDGNKREWDHDADFGPDAISELLYGPKGKKGKALAAKCTLDYRNRPRPVKVLLRYQRKDLHVYVNSDGASGEYTFCLAVNVDIDTRESHSLAFTAMTGQVADIHQITQITTRYLDENDPVLDDWVMRRQGGGIVGSWPVHIFCWFAVMAVSGYISYGSWVTYSEYKEHMVKKGNTVSFCYRVTNSRSLDLKIVSAMMLFFCFDANYAGVIIFLPKMLFHAYEFMTNFKLQTANLEKNTGICGISFERNLQIELGCGVLGVIYSICSFLNIF